MTGLARFRIGDRVAQTETLDPGVWPGHPKRGDRLTVTALITAEAWEAMYNVRLGEVVVAKDDAGGTHYLNQADVVTVPERWEGAVQEVYGDGFIAEVHRLSDGEVATVEMDLSEVADRDRRILAPGALFWWDVDDTGSRVRFRRVDDEASDV